MDNSSSNNTCILVATFPSDKGYVVTQIYNQANNYISLAVGGCAPGQSVTPNVPPYSNQWGDQQSVIVLDPGVSVSPGSSLYVIGGGENSGHVFVNGYTFTPSP